ncbi:xylan 1,4-beta-xylosidase [Nitrosospira sp. Nl5]|uniref:GH39 family glycosyl hydrolase n=1 Tax=Nitrosospira sp. Nl5 TaxID=200120 RepID=UPI0008907CCA|nr:beta-xylosidase [Nitrosospira sp. Nl5]SCY71985.1 xylan 1,4-beta-xylosidase [Nitrosospira sp. Nl5]
MATEFKSSLSLTAASIPLRHSWEHTVGSGRALLALRADWREQLMRAHAELGFRHVRFHGVLDDEIGTLVRHNEQALYSFFNADQINDYLLSIGMKPFVELSFMPAILASGDATVFQYRANITPPKDYREWGKLIDRLVRHWGARYGLDEIREWCLEVWNEPNLKAFWTGGKKGYYELYRTTAETIKNIDSALKVGGPSSAQNAWIPEFLDYCDKHKLPVDFISTHYYPTDAFGKIGTDTLTQLEHAPRDVMKKRAKIANAQARGLPLYYTEWNVSSNPRDPLHDQSFAAAFAANIALSVDALVAGYSFWTFTDIFEENYFPSQPFHGGFGLLNLHGIPKPIYRAFQLLHGLGDKLCHVEGSHDTVNVWVSRGADVITVFLTNYAMPRHEICTVAVHVQLTAAPKPLSAHVMRIDENNVNPERVWREMGKPEYLSLHDVETLQAASVLNSEPYPLRILEDHIEFDISMPPQSVATVKIECAPSYAST